MIPDMSRTATPMPATSGSMNGHSTERSDSTPPLMSNFRNRPSAVDPVRTASMSRW
jgi:hypothetical protein